MTETRDLLIEIGTEELPPKALKLLSEAFTVGIRDGLDNADLAYGEVEPFASPRRLAVLVHELQTAQADKEVERRGPAITAAFDEEGCPSKAAIGFAKSCGVEVEQLDKLENDKGSWLVFRSEQKGQTTQTLVPAIVQQSLDKLPIPKRMRWGDLDVQFVRPVHWLVLLFGDEVIEANILGVHSGRETRGHRFHHPDTIYIGEPAAYAPMLTSHGHVIADFSRRREAIRGQVMEAAAAIKGKAVIDDDLLDEVCSMVEWPVAIMGNFEDRFLEVPSEALISAMKRHQKYFHIVDEQGKLLPHFITISNIESSDLNVVRAGNERVIRPRLSDAAFFWSQDLKQKLASRVESLKTVVFQNKLGTLFDKTLRITSLAGVIAKHLQCDHYLAERAAELSKCDLMTDMVGEFPELQGIMGHYYATANDEPAEVAAAIEEHYMPRFAGDDLPASLSGQAVAIADKLDSMVGIFGIGQAPTGDKDPFALRRAALGIIRILLEKNLELSLPDLIQESVNTYMQQQKGLIKKGTAEQVYEFITGRLHMYYSSQGFVHDEIDAVICLQPSHMNDIDKRLRALSVFRKLPEAESLAAANKRISNIIKQAEVKIPEWYDPEKLQEESEKLLSDKLAALAPIVEPMLEKRNYEEAMKQLAGLRESVDAFFDHVMVMADDEVLRDNRLALLNTMRNLFLRVADLSRLQ